MHPVFLLILGISCPRQNTWLISLLNSPHPQILPKLSQRKSSTFISTWTCYYFSNTLTKGVFHHYFNIPVNNSNEFYWVTHTHTHTHTHTQSLQLFTFNRLVFSPPDLSAQYLSTFFSFSVFSIFAYDTVLIFCFYLWR